MLKNGSQPSKMRQFFRIFKAIKGDFLKKFTQKSKKLIFILKNITIFDIMIIHPRKALTCNEKHTLLSMCGGIKCEEVKTNWKPPGDENKSLFVFKQKAAA